MTFLFIGISFTPKEVGEHVVSVMKNGKHVTNSPFKIMVGQSEIGDASKVNVYGQGLVEGHTLELAEFIVDTRNAGNTRNFFFKLTELLGCFQTNRLLYILILFILLFNLHVKQLFTAV